MPNKAGRSSPLLQRIESHQSIRGSPLVDTQGWTNTCFSEVTSSESLSEIQSLLNSPSGVALAMGFQTREAQKLIDSLDRVLVSRPRLDDKLWLRGLRLIRKVSKTRRIVPSSYQLQEESIRTGEVRFEGGSAVVSDGRYQGRTVAIKRLKVNEGDFDRIFKLFCREVIVWKHLSHPNIFPLMGVSISADTHCLRILTEWMANGNVVRYARSNPAVNRLQLLSEVMSGVTYLHDLKIVHGDLKGANILVDDQGTALLTDFGLMTMVDMSAFLSATPGSPGGTYRWMSPELLDPDGFGSDGRPTRESDRYALGMVIYEVLTGLRPFYDMRGITFIPPVVRGKRPEKPPYAESLGFSGALWGLVQLCWSATGSSRPTARELFEQLSIDSPHWDPPAQYPIPGTNTFSAADLDSSGSSQGSMASSKGRA